SRGGEAAAAGPVEPPGPRRRSSPAPEPRAGIAPQLVVVAGKGHEPGVSWDVARGAMLGRSDGAEIRVEDNFASSSHARIFSRGDFMYLEDMGSTHGTYLNGRQIRSPERLKLADVIRIGDSEYRY